MRRFVLAVFATLLAAPAFAQSYPDHPIRIIVPTPAGGPVDVMARLVAAALPAKLGQNVVIENKPGAGNIIGSKIGPRAAGRLYADGVGGERADHEPDDLRQCRLRRVELCADRTDRRNAAALGDQCAAAVQNRRRPRRLCEGQSGQAELFDRRHRHTAASRLPPAVVAKPNAAANAPGPCRPHGGRNQEMEADYPGAEFKAEVIRPASSPVKPGAPPPSVTGR